MTTATAKTKKLFIPVTKVDAEKGIVYGVLASATPDRADEVFDYAGSKPYFEKWSGDIHKATDGKSFGNLRSMHGQVAAGKFTQMVFNDDDEQIEVAAKVVDPVELQKVIEGVYTGFSIGGKYVSRKKVGDHTSYIADPYEGSLVDLPCIPDATFEVVKGAQSEVRKFVTVQAPAGDEPVLSNDDIASKAKELAKAAGKEDWFAYLDAARAALVKAAGAASAVSSDLEASRELPLAVTAVDEAVEKSAGSEDIGAVQVWTHPTLPGETFTKKADLVKALDVKKATATAAELAAPVHAAASALTEILDKVNPDDAGKGKANGDDGDVPAKGKAKADDKTKAKQEADKSKPMKSAQDVLERARVVVVDGEVPSFVALHSVAKAARQFDVTSDLPDAFSSIMVDVPPVALAKRAGGKDLAKAANLNSVSSLISLVSQLESFHTCASGMGSDGYFYYSDTTTKIDVSPDLLTKISTMCDELGALAAELLDEILAAMKSDEAQKAYALGTALGDLRKVGARNSTADKGRLRKAHDLLAEIDPDMCGGDTEKHAHGDVEKRANAEREAFKTELDGFKSLLEDVAKRVTAIYNEPTSGRPSSLRSIEKGLDIIDISGDGNNSRDNRAAFAEIQGTRGRLAFNGS